MKTLRLKVEKDGLVQFPVELLKRYPIEDKNDPVIFESIPNEPGVVCLRHSRD